MRPTGHAWLKKYRPTLQVEGGRSIHDGEQEMSRVRPRAVPTRHDHIVPPPLPNETTPLVLVWTWCGFLTAPHHSLPTKRIPGFQMGSCVSLVFDLVDRNKVCSKKKHHSLKKKENQIRRPICVVAFTPFAYIEEEKAGPQEMITSYTLYQQRQLKRGGDGRGKGLASRNVKV